ncbi:hypothetical protein [Rhodanobacter lindaniclasticus]
MSPGATSCCTEQLLDVAVAPDAVTSVASAELERRGATATR